MRKDKEIDIRDVDNMLIKYNNYEANNNFIFLPLPYMIQLSHHIEYLLLESDCVIVPGLGGFVAYYSHASYMEKESEFHPPYRTIGFNPELKINDGLLAESYMSVYGIDFGEANKRIDNDVDELLTILHDDGRIEFVNIGLLCYNVEGKYEFKPYENKLVSPLLYGLSTFNISMLSQEKSLFYNNIDSERTKQTNVDESPSYIIRLNRTFVRAIAAVAAMILLLFVFSTPVDNNLSNNKAELLPNELINKLKSKSLLTNLIDNNTNLLTTSKNTDKKINQNATKIIVGKPKHVKATHNSFINNKHITNTAVLGINDNKMYHVIVASKISLKRANEFVSQLKQNGYNEAKVLKSKKIIRVCIASYNNEFMAHNKMNELTKKTEYKSLWVMKDKLKSID